jgi:hypothetical protein
MIAWGVVHATKVCVHVKLGMKVTIAVGKFQRQHQVLCLLALNLLRLHLDI